MPPTLSSVPLVRVRVIRTANNLGPASQRLRAVPTVRSLSVAGEHAFIDPLDDVTSILDEQTGVDYFDVVATDDADVAEAFGWQISLLGSQRPLRTVSVPQAGSIVERITVVADDGQPYEMPAVWLHQLADFSGPSGATGSDLATRSYVDDSITALQDAPDPFPQYLMDGQGGGAGFSGNAADITSGVLGEARIPDTITRDSELAAAVSAVAASANPGSLAGPARVLFARVAARESAPVPLVVLGSSSAAGQGASSSGRPMMERWAAGMQADFPLASGAAQPTPQPLAAGMTLANGVQLIRGAVGGTTSANYLTAAKVDQVAALAPAVVLHMIGANDYGSQVPAATYKANMAGWLDALDAAITAPHLHLLVQAHRPRKVAQTVPWSAYGTALRELAAARPTNCLFIDLSGPFHTVGQDVNDPLGWMVDDLHLNDSGHAFGGAILRAATRLTTPLPSVWVPAPDPSGDVVAPTVPTSLTATPGNGQATLAWTASTDAVGVAKYRVRRGGAVVAEPTGTSVTVTGLTNGTAYSFTVSALDAAGNESAQTSAVTATPAAPPSPDTTAPMITSFAATPGNAQVALAWAGTDNVAVTRWVLTRGGTTVYDGTATSFTDTGRTNGTALSYSLTAYDAAGNASATATATATPAAETEPATVTSGTLLSWYKADAISGKSDGDTVAAWPDSGPNAYNLAATGAPTWRAAQANGKPCVRMPATGTNYLANDAVNRTQPFTIFFVSRLAAPASGNPCAVGGGPSTDVSLYMNDSQAFQVWAGNNSGQTASATLTALHIFDAVVNGSSSSIALDGTAVSASLGANALTGLTLGSNSARNGLFYRGDLFEVIAYAGALSAADRAAVRNYLATKYAIGAADTTPPSAPTGLAAGSPTSAAVPLSWTAATDNVGVAKYRIRRGGTIVAEPTGTSYTDTGLAPSTAYSWTVSAVDAAGNEGPQTAAVTATTAAGSGGGGGTPDYTTGMIFDFDSESVTGLADGATVSSWASQGGSAGALSVIPSYSTGPGFYAGQINGRPALRFASSVPNRLLTADGTPIVPGAGATHVYVLKRTGPSARMFGSFSGSVYHALFDTGSANGLAFGVGSLSGPTYAVSVLNRWIIVIAVANGASSKLVIGNEATVTGTVGTNNGEGVSIGGSGSGSGYGTFDLAKYRAYDHAFTDAEIDSLRSYLNNRYALT